MIFVNKSSMRLGGGVKSNYSVSAFHIYPDCSLQQFLFFFFPEILLIFQVIPNHLILRSALESAETPSHKERVTEAEEKSVLLSLTYFSE